MAVIGEASVVVKADTRGFKADAESGVAKALSGAAAKAESALSRLGASGGGALAKVGDIAGKVALKVGEIGLKAVAAAGALAAGAFGTLFTIGIRTAASLEQAQVGFNALLGGVDEGRAFFRSLIDLANESAFEVSQLTGPAQVLLAVFKGDAPAARAALGTIGDAVALLGRNSPEVLQRVAEGFGKAASQGKFTAESLDIIAEALPGFSARGALAAGVAAKLGITVEEAMKKISDGQVSAATGTTILLDQLNKFPGVANAMKTQSQTLGGVLSTFSDTFKSALAFDLAGPLVDPIKQAIKDITGPIGDSLKQLGQQFAPVGTKALPTIVRAVNAIVKAIPPAAGALARFGGSAIQVLAVVLPPLLRGLGTLFRGVGDAVGFVVRPFVDFARQAAGSERVVLALFETLGRSINAFRTVGQAISTAVGRVSDAFGRARGDYGRFGQDVGVRIPSALDLLVGAITVAGTVASGLATVIVTVLDTIGPPLATLIQDTGKFLSDNGPAIGAVLDTIGTTIGKAFGGVAGIAKDLGDLFKVLADNQGVMIAAQSALAGIAAGLVAVKTASAISSAVSAIGNLGTIIGGLTTAFPLLTNPIGLIVAGVVALGTAAFLAYRRFEPFRNVVDAVGRFLRDTFLTALDAVVGFFRGPFLDGIGFVTDQFGKLADLLAPIVTRVVDALAPIVTRVVGFFQDLPNRIGPALDALGGFFGQVADVAGRAFGAVRTAIQPFLDWFAANVLPTIQAGVEFFAALFDDIAKVVDQILIPILRFVGRVFAEAFDQALFVIRLFATQVGPILRIIGATIEVVFKTALAFIAPIIRTIGTIISVGVKVWVEVFKVAFKVVVDVVGIAFRLVKGLVEGGLRILKGLFELGTAILTGSWGKAWQGIKDVVSGVLRSIGAVVQAAIELLITVITRGFQGIIDVGGAIIRGLVSIVSRVMDEVVRFVTEMPGRIVDFLSTVGSALWDAFSGAVEFLLNQVNERTGGLVAFFASIPERIVGALASFGTIVWDGIKSGFDFIVTQVSGIVDTLAGFFTALPGRIVGIGTDLLNAGKDIGGKIISGVLDGIGAAGSFAADFGKSIANAAIRAVNFIIDKVNAIELKFDPPIGPSFTLGAPDIPKIPELASGAIVRPRPGGTLARIAEAGRAEAVIPLSAGLLDGLKAIAAGTTAPATTGPLVGQLIVNGGRDPEGTAFSAVRELAALKFRNGG